MKQLSGLRMEAWKALEIQLARDPFDSVQFLRSANYYANRLETMDREQEYPITELELSYRIIELLAVSGVETVHELRTRILNRSIYRVEGMGEQLVKACTSAILLWERRVRG